MFFSLALLTPPYVSLTYAPSAWLDGFSWKKGLRVVVPLVRTLRSGVILDQTEDIPKNCTIRQILWPLEREPLLNEENLELVRQLALRQAVNPGKILASVLPVGLRIPQLRLRSFLAGKAVITTLKEIADATTQVEKALKRKKSFEPLFSNALIELPESRNTLPESSKKHLPLSPQHFLPENTLPLVESEKRLPAFEKLHALGKQWLNGEADLLDPAEDSAASEYCALLADPPWQVRPAATRQIALLEMLWEEGVMSRREIVRRMGSEIAPTLKALIAHGLIALRRSEEMDAITESSKLLMPPVNATPLVFSQAQQEALRFFDHELASGNFGVRLIFGVTGSGKTALYLECIRKTLLLGKSAFLLAPEVALAYKLWRDATLAFPNIPIIFFHGYQRPQLRERTFRALATRQQPCLVIGTRSALFLPAPNLGLVILDEEHDASFKQDEGLPYQAKEVAWFRMQRQKGLLLLGSATPDIKTFYAAQQGKIALSVLPDRVGGGTLPQIRLVDLRTAKSDSLLAPESVEELKKTIQRGEQAVILLNRRGYSRQMYCLNCGETLRCPQCDISLTWHKGRERMICHYCGYSVPFPIPCPSCKGLHYHPLGEGTERLEEAIPTLLPAGSRVLRLDRDSTRRQGTMEAILESFARKEAQVLVGTQMLSKGHHFPDVTLVIIADADLGLSFPDYRATERTFQLLLQSAGRAGRSNKPGKVLIQTRDMKEYCWDFVQRNDYLGFYAKELALRKQYRYPPFVNLALVRISYEKDWTEGGAKMSAIAKRLREKSKDVVVMGPTSAPISMVRGRLRFHCLLKAENWQAIRSVYATILPLAEPPHLRISLDIDPVNML